MIGIFVILYTTGTLVASYAIAVILYKYLGNLGTLLFIGLVLRWLSMSIMPKEGETK